MKKMYISLLALAMLIPSTVLASFSDVSEAHPYSEAINWMSDNGVINGYPDGTFGPDICVNRVEMLKMLFLMNGTDLITEEGTSMAEYYETMFSDVDTTQWYWPYLHTALRNGTVEGYPDGTFHPTDCVKRVEAIKMDVLGFNEGEVPETDGYAGISLLYSSYQDIDYDQWYGEYMEYALPRYILGESHVDTEDNPDADWGTDVYYAPGGDMSRAEVAEMLYRTKAMIDLGEFRYTEGMVPNSIESSDLEESEESEEVADEESDLPTLTRYWNEDYDLSFLIPDGWEVTSEEEVAQGEITQLRLLLNPEDDADSNISIYTPPLETGYIGFEFQDGVDHEIYGLELLSSWIGTNVEADRMMSRDAYAVDPEEWTTNIELSLSTPNQGDVFDGYLEDYNGVLDTLHFQRNLTTYTAEIREENSLEIMLPAGWKLVEEETTEYDEFTQFYALFQPRDNEDVYISFYNPPLEIGYHGYEMEDGIDYPLLTADLVVSKKGISEDLDRMMSIDQYTVDSDDWFSHYEFIYSTPNSEETFEEYLRDYKDFLDFTSFE
jgi:hypothetical protein